METPSRSRAARPHGVPARKILRIRMPRRSQRRMRGSAYPHPHHFITARRTRGSPTGPLERGHPVRGACLVDFLSPHMRGGEGVECHKGDRWLPRRQWHNCWSRCAHTETHKHQGWLNYLGHLWLDCLSLVSRRSGRVPSNPARPVAASDPEVRGPTPVRSTRALATTRTQPQPSPFSPGPRNLCSPPPKSIRCAPFSPQRRALLVERRRSWKPLS